MHQEMIWGQGGDPQWADHIQGARRISARLSDWVVNNAHSPHLRPHQQCIGITSCAHSANNNSFIGNNLCKIPSIHVSWSFQSGIFYVKSPTCVPLSAGRWPSQGAWLRLVMVGLCTAVRFPNPWNNQQAGWEAWQWWWTQGLSALTWVAAFKSHLIIQLIKIQLQNLNQT